MAKTAYRVKNWGAYNKSLVKRGDVTVWIEDEVADSWYSAGPISKIGRPWKYSDAAIECLLTIGAVFSLPLRQSTGFINSILKMLGMELEVPCYTTVSRRASKLKIDLPVAGTATIIVVDSTGLKVFGEGEWKVRVHGVGKRRTWRKLHLSVDADTGYILAGVLTTNDVHDSKVLKDLVPSTSQGQEIMCDGAYDTHEIFNHLSQNGATPVIPVRRGAKIRQHGNSKEPALPRDEVIRGMRTFGRKGWKKKSGYHKRSLAETAIYRVKTIFGDKLRARNFERQATEAFIKLRALNKMTALGMPKSQKVAA